jgi:hypothetical protein
VLAQSSLQIEHTNDPLNGLRFDPASGPQLKNHLVTGRKDSRAFQVNPLDLPPFPAIFFLFRTAVFEMRALQESPKVMALGRSNYIQTG